MNELGLLPGMAVRSADGERLGRVKHVREDGTIEVGRRLFAPHECLVRYSDVAAVRGDYVVLKLTGSQWRGESPRPEEPLALGLTGPREQSARTDALGEFDMGAEESEENASSSDRTLDRGVSSDERAIAPDRVLSRGISSDEREAPRPFRGEEASPSRISSLEPMSSPPFHSGSAELDDQIIPQKLRLRETGWSESESADYPSHDPSHAVAAYLRELRAPMIEEQIRRRDAESSLTQEPGALRVPLMEERPRVERHEVPGGEVRIHKTVVSEPVHLSVPVTIETVRVERVTPSEAAPDPDPSHAFVEETITVPVRQQQVELVKRPVLREEIHVALESQEEELELETELRREGLSAEDSASHVHH